MERREKGRARRREAIVAKFGGRYEDLEREASAPDSPGEELRRIADQVLYERENGAPGVPPELAAAVMDLLADPIDGVFEAVARHPNCPPDLMVSLLPYFRDAVCENPVLPLVPLEAPGLLLDAPDGVLRHLLRSPNLPATLTGLLSRTGGAEIAEEAALHVSLAGEVPPGGWREAIQDYWRSIFERSAAEGGGASLSARLCLTELSEVGLWPAWLGPPPAAPPAGELEGEAARAADDALRAVEARYGSEAAARLQAARDPAAPPELLARCTEHPDWAVRLAVLRNPAAPAPLVTAGGRHSYPPHFGPAAAMHPNADPETLVGMLANTHDARVRALVRRHPGVRSSAELSARAAQAARTLLVSGGWGAFADAPPEVAAFCRFCGGLQASEMARRQHAEADDWRERLTAALSLGLPQPGRPGRASAFVPPDRARMEALADDGNRLVRAAARARLADPSLEFPV